MRAPFLLFGPLLLIWLAATVVWIWAIVDIVKVPDDSMFRAGNKLVWVLVVVFTHVIGAVIYFLIGRPEPGRRPGPSAPPPPPPGTAP
jgi:hypothetical protein